jgi:AraC-like DNA-binding protein
MQMNTSNQPAPRTDQPDLDRNSTGDISVEKHYSVPELARLWHLSETTIRRMFEHEAGVLVWGRGEGRFKRRYRTLRIPERVVLRVHRQLRGAG